MNHTIQSIKYFKLFIINDYYLLHTCLTKKGIIEDDTRFAHLLFAKKTSLKAALNAADSVYYEITKVMFSSTYIYQFYSLVFNLHYSIHTNVYLFILFILFLILNDTRLYHKNGE